MAQKTVAELEAEVKKLEAQLAEEYKKKDEARHVKELQNKILRLKYGKQLQMASTAVRKGKIGLVAAAKFVNKAFKTVQAHERKLEAREREADKENKSNPTRLTRGSVKKAHKKKGHHYDSLPPLAR
jgi:DNA replication initiation complex subunit (GINS family)